MPITTEGWGFLKLLGMNDSAIAEKTSVSRCGHLPTHILQSTSTVVLSPLELGFLLLLLSPGTHLGPCLGLPQHPLSLETIPSATSEDPTQGQRVKSPSSGYPHCASCPKDTARGPIRHSYFPCEGWAITRQSSTCRTCHMGQTAVLSQACVWGLPQPPTPGRGPWSPQTLRCTNLHQHLCFAISSLNTFLRSLICQAS